MRCIIGIDIGTSGTKAISFSQSGEVIHSAYEAYPTISWHPDQQELEPQTLLAAVVKTIQQSLSEIDQENLKGISFSCAMHSVIAISKTGLPLTNAITWADSRSKAYATQLKQSVAGRRIYERTGTPIHPMSPLCKIMWMREKKPELFAETHKFISIKEWIWYHLFEKFQVDYSIASGTGLFDIRTLNWCEEALSVAGLSADRLSEPVSPVHTERGITNGLEKKLGLTKEIPFIIGAGDGCLANLGSGAIKHGDLSVTIGTSGAVRMVSEHPSQDDKERIFNYLLNDHTYVTGGAINNGGVAIKWYVENFMGKNNEGSRDFSTVVAETDSIVPGSEGLIFLPYLLGERAPVWDADAKGVFFGIYAGHTSLHFLRSVIEGISFSLYQIGKLLEEIVAPIERIYASGGFIQSTSWLQMMADIFDKDVYVTYNADASSIGASILGFLALGEIDSLQRSDQFIQIQQSFHPIEKNHRTYMKNFSIFAVLYEKLKHEFSELSKLNK